MIKMLTKVGVTAIAFALLIWLTPKIFGALHSLPPIIIAIGGLIVFGVMLVASILWLVIWLVGIYANKNRQKHLQELESSAKWYPNHRPTQTRQD